MILAEKKKQKVSEIKSGIEDAENLVIAPLMIPMLCFFLNLYGVLIG